MAITPEQSDLRDHHLPMQDNINVRITRSMKAGIISSALTEKRDTASVIRRWIRLGALTEGVPIDSW